MTDPYPEARRHARLDTTDHGQLIEQNRAALLRDRCEELQQQIRTLEDAHKVVPHSEEIPQELAAKRDELERLGARIEHLRGRR